MQLPYHLKLLSPPSPDGQQSPESTDRDRGEGQREMAPSVPRMEWKITVAEVNVPSREPAWGEIESDEQVQPFGEELATEAKAATVEGLPRSRRAPSHFRWMMQSKPSRYGLGEQTPPIANDRTGGQ